MPFSFGNLKRNKHNGTATLAVGVPGPGTLDLTGEGIKTQRAGGGAVASRAVTGAGVVNLLIRPRRDTKKRLNKTGKAKVKVSVAYTPTGGTETNTQSERVKLVKKH